MTAYVDSSVLLRIVLGQPNKLAEWPSIRTGVSSVLLEVECLRTLDRLRLAQSVPDAELAERRAAVFRLLRSMYQVELSPVVLRRASQPLPTLLGTLDALHLTTALLCRDQLDEELIMATHDRALATAARSLGFLTIGD